jgi:hypothetical protein
VPTFGMGAAVDSVPDVWTSFAVITWLTAENSYWNNVTLWLRAEAQWEAER